MGRLGGLVAQGALVAVLAGCNPAYLLQPHTTIPAHGANHEIPALDVSIDDPQGLVRSISATDPVETPNPVDVVPGSENAYRVTWLGGYCDTHTTLSIGWVGVRLGITVRSDQSGSGCTQVGIRRQVIITLKQFVPSTQITLAQ
jgi:hypothetical protein